MVQTLGKRKRRDQIAELDRDVNPATEEHHDDEPRTLLQQHFEAKFAPLENLSLQPPNAAANQKLLESPEEPGSDWEGISEPDDQPAEIVDWATSPLSSTVIPKDELKMFMTSKPPSHNSRPISTVKRKQLESDDRDEAVTDAANLRKDLALQRLLKESHLLDPQFSLTHSGLNRHKALDLRLQDMGSKSSIFSQQKMPLAQRKGILTKAAEREGNRRREAQENGIILEKAVKGKLKPDKKRQRGIGLPSVGKFQGGMLKLSKKDVSNIEGPRRGPRRKK